MKVEIRKAVPSDMEEIINLCEEHAEYEKASYERGGKSEKLASFLFSGSPRLYCLIAEVEGKVAGYATYMFEFSTWDADFYIHMDCLFVRSAFRGHGLGELLVKEIAIAAQKANCPLIQWQTPDFNERAIKFYHRIGATGKNKVRMFLDATAIQLLTSK